VPNLDEFNTLIASLGGKSSAGKALKTSGKSDWAAPNSDATNSSGFSARGIGYINRDGNHVETFNSTHFWTNYSKYFSGTGTSGSTVWYALILQNNPSYAESENTDVGGDGSAKSVRCVKN
jgi:uncharacterized protein (TIGR02145 family)